MAAPGGGADGPLDARTTCKYLCARVDDGAKSDDAESAEWRGAGRRGGGGVGAPRAPTASGCRRQPRSCATGAPGGAGAGTGALRGAGARARASAGAGARGGVGAGATRRRRRRCRAERERRRGGRRPPAAAGAAGGAVKEPWQRAGGPARRCGNGARRS
ncbi:hypothetical protein FGB62_206g08 [Gracilaria domingensis]|nr:hypothetical protein FGB62_206g08 [Gracilaria domingensis]